ncbi:MAG: cation:proton antiporter [Pseudomonadota bacterium]
MGGTESSFFLIFTGAALLATLALQLRQPILVAYIALGALLGPYGFGFVDDTELLGDISRIGIAFLLFMLGLDLQPQSLMRLFGRMSLVTAGSSLAFAAAGAGIAWAFGFTPIESMVIGVTMMFSSTIISLKLLPTTALHHKHTGELVIGITLLQDVLAILALILLAGDPGQRSLEHLGLALVALPLLAIGAGVAVRFALVPLLMRFDRYKEYILLLAVGWCLGVAELAHVAGLSREIGAFVAGVALASSPIAFYIAEQLKTLRDFFLVMFFFTVGAGLNHNLLGDISIAALVLGGAMLVMKPVVFSLLLQRVKEPKDVAWEIGFRLGHCSEFSLLLAYLAVSTGLLGEAASVLVQATTIFTMLVASYIVVFRYPSPIAVSDRLRRD